MTVRFYLPSTGTAPAVSPAASSAWTVTTGAGYLPTKTTKSGTTHADGTARVSAVAGAYRNVLDRVYVSDPIAAQIIPAGTFSAVIRGLESIATANGWLQVIIRVVSSDGLTVRGTIYAGSTAAVTPVTTAGAENQEWATSAATRIKSALATTAVTAQDGDRILIEVGHRYNASATTSTYTLRYGDLSATDFALTAALTTDLAPWVELSHAVRFPPAAWPGGSTIGQPRTGGIVTAGAGSTTMAVPYPSGVADGEFLAIALPARSAATTDPTYTASGWTTVQALSGDPATGGGFIRQTVLYKIAAAGDVGASTVTVTSTAVLRSAEMIAVSGVDTANPLDGTPTLYETPTTSTAAPTMASQTPTVTGCMPLWFVTGFLGPGVTWEPTPGTLTDTVEWLDTWQDVPTDANNGRSGAAYYQPPLADTAATGTRGGIPSAAATSAGVYMLLRPATTASPKTGTAAGSWSFAGVGTGSTTRRGTGAGSWAFTGTAAGKRSPTATATGAFTFTGTASGKRTPKATASGSWSFTGTAAGVALLPPTGVTVTPVSSSQLNLSWNSVSGATGYDIERNGVVIVTNYAGTSYSDTGLAAGTAFTYRVRATA